MRDRAWFVRLNREIIIDRTGAQTMLYLTCTTIIIVDFAHYGLSRAKDWVSVDCGTIQYGVNRKDRYSLIGLNNILFIKFKYKLQKKWNGI